MPVFRVLCHSIVVGVCLGWAFSGAMADEKSAVSGFDQVASGLEDSGYYDSPVPLHLSNGRDIALVGTTSQGVGVWVDGEIQFPKGESEKGRYPTLQQVGGDVYAVWWRKTHPSGEKHFYASTAPEGTLKFSPVVSVNREGQPLARYGFAADGEGSAVLVYLDERSKRYRIYSTYSADRGLTWQHPDQQLDHDQGDNGFTVVEATEPTISYGNGRYVAVWKDRGQYQDRREAYRSVTSYSTDHGKTWSAPKAVAENADRFLIDDTVLFSKGRFLYSGLLGGTDDIKLVVFQSQDGVVWESKDSLHMPVKSSLLHNAAGKDLLHVVFVGGEGKRQVFYGGYNIETGHWMGPGRRLDVKPYEGYKSTTPTILELDNGVVAAAWEDYRHIRPSIYMNYSWDGGAHWQNASYPIEQSPGKFRSVYPQLSALTGGRLTVWLSRYEDDSAASNQSLLKKTLSFDKNGEKVTGLAVEPAYDETVRQKRLEERVNAFWTAREKNKDEDVFDLYDPFFQTRMDKKKFTEQGISSIQYHEHHLDKMEIVGPVARVKVLVSFEIPPTTVQGTEIKQPKSDRAVVMEWIWMDENWFLKFESLGNTFLKY